MYLSPIHWCFIVTWLCQIDNLWENALCMNNLDTEILGGLRAAGRNGRVRAIWFGLLGRPSMSIRGSRGPRVSQQSTSSSTLLRMSGSSAQAVWQKHASPASQVAQEFTLRFSYHGPIAILLPPWEHTTLTPRDAVKGWLGFQDRCVRRQTWPFL